MQQLRREGSSPTALAHSLALIHACVHVYGGVGQIPRWDRARRLGKVTGASFPAWLAHLWAGTSEAHTAAARSRQSARNNGKDQPNGGGSRSKGVHSALTTNNGRPAPPRQKERVLCFIFILLDGDERRGKGSRPQEARAHLAGPPTKQKDVASLASSPSAARKL